MMVLRRGPIWLFLNDEGKEKLDKDELMIALICGRMEGTDNLSMDSDIWSGSVLLVLVFQTVF